MWSVIVSVLAAIRNAVGTGAIVEGPAIEPRYLRDWAVAMPSGRPLALVRPKSTDEVSATLRICHDAGVPVVPQGGLTGLAGGATPSEGCVVLSLERMTGIEDLDEAAATMTVLAGTPLQVIQDAARAAGLFFALDLGARGSCQIGGNVATNAGGNRVIRYGMTRDLVLGIEVVLADGTVLTSLNKLIKNNAGFDLRQIFVGPRARSVSSRALSCGCTRSRAVSVQRSAPSKDTTRSSASCATRASGSAVRFRRSK